ncbi:MAG: hypothetical protein AAGB46_19455, partial [Verrucomicrobiota bacterium]
MGGAPLDVERDIAFKSWTFSTEYFLGNWTFIAEYQNTYNDIDNSQQIGAGPLTASKVTTLADGWYLGGSRRFLERFEAGILYVAYHSNARDRDGSDRPIPHTAYVKDKQFSIRYDVNSFWSLKAEFHLLEGTGRLFNQWNQKTTRSAWEVQRIVT